MSYEFKILRDALPQEVYVEVIQHRWRRPSRRSVVRWSPEDSLIEHTETEKWVNPWLAWRLKRAFPRIGKKKSPWTELPAPQTDRMCDPYRLPAARVRKE